MIHRVSAFSFNMYKVCFLVSGVPAATEEYYKVVYDYAPENDDELPLKTGDVIVVTDKFICDGWWEGTCNGKTGVFPNNFVNSTPLTDSTPKEKVLFNFTYCIEFVNHIS